MANLSLQNLQKSYGSAHVIKGVDIEIADGEFTVFVGPSGCGKSTLLRMIAGLEDISGGDLYIGDRQVNEVQPKERGIAMVFQSYAIFPHMTVRENIGFGLTIEGVKKDEWNERVNEAARILQMEHLLDRRPSQLSGGQRQRVAIGRAIVRKPAVFLFDEPLSNLDAALRMDMRMEIGKLHKQLDATMIYVTHDQVEAMTLADKIVVLKDGKVMQIGAPMELYHKPANLFVARFIGSPAMNLLDVTVAESTATGHIVQNGSLDPVEIATDTQAKPGDKLILGIRPQYLDPSHDPSAGKLHGTVSITERLGTETILDLTLTDGSKLVAALPEDAIFKPEETVSLTFDPARAHLFQPEDA
ncbi:ABC transporter ATP-binding protein [Tropicimonas marinistellae]|uniref:ABC transporter ATP-binding protein n=1 Tax=Tropicimonas marinistellae TaxID=1739787 RepID=UPI00082974B3|nr:sn-glycerol-3-phosphate ABC transporter ATP-binding protein UgpC [Tropicimonas marinistellae]